MMDILSHTEIVRQGTGGFPLDSVAAILGQSSVEIAMAIGYRESDVVPIEIVLEMIDASNKRTAAKQKSRLLSYLVMGRMLCPDERLELVTISD